MSYEDPQSGRDRNLGQEDAGSSTGSLMLGIVLLAAIAFGGWYFYTTSEKVADNKPAATATTADSGTTPQSSQPGMQGDQGG
jgi:hypothetical protein